MFKFLFGKKRIYCQKCGKEIIRNKENPGGYVSADGRVFCLRENMNSFYGDSMNGEFQMDYRTYKELREDVKNEKLIQFTNPNKLETVLRG